MIRKAVLEDLEVLYKIETTCFNKNEAAKKENIRERLMIYPEYFWVFEQDGKVIGFINGLLSKKNVLEDEMFNDANLHDEDGKWLILLSVCTLPEYRNRGIASSIMNEVLKEMFEKGKNGLVLTCKKELIDYYRRFGFKSSGISKSTHGGVVWYDMILKKQLTNE